MIDVESEVYTPIATALREEFPGVYVTPEYVRAPAKFPHVSIVEADNYLPVQYLDNADSERYAGLMYEVNVYSNKATGRKQEARSIMDQVDRAMYALNFRRTVLTPVPNMEDATIYRLTARYTAATDGTYIYRM